MVKFGDAGTKFFHTIATIRHRRNLITSLFSQNGFTSSHEDEEKLIWEAFKDRLGTLEFKGILCNLQPLIHPSSNLSDLEEEFSCEEIDSVVKELPNDKSPRPDGFSNEFIKNAGPLLNLTSTNFYEYGRLEMITSLITRNHRQWRKPLEER